MIVNALGGLENPNLALARPQGDNLVDSSMPDVDARAIRDTHAAGVTAVNVTLGYVGGADEPFEYTIRTIGVWDAILRRYAGDLVKVYTAADILAAEKSGKIGIIYGFQNGAMMGADPSRADIFADLGVRVIQLTYNPANQIGHGCMSVDDTGLSPFGHEVVERLNASRIMVDLSHSGTRTCLDAARASASPISINHTGCRALTDLPRNKSDEELRLVASKGGFVGIYFMPFLKPDGQARAEDVVAHIDHAVDVCGEDHVGIGTDGSATPIDDLGAYGAFLAKQVEDRRKSGLGATGERADSYPFVVDLRGVEQFRKLSRLLKARGYPEARIEKILGLNFLRFARDVWGE
ncbi:MAG: membrane dipeptidase [Rhizomicrobium sp.]|jgi:membrane dipeptidase